MSISKEKIRDYLEIHLSSHENDVMDSEDRLVWLSDVVDAVDQLVKEECSCRKRAVNDLKPSGFGVIVDKSKATKFYDCKTGETIDLKK